MMPLFINALHVNRFELQLKVNNKIIVLLFLLLFSSFYVFTYSPMNLVVCTTTITFNTLSI